MTPQAGAQPPDQLPIQTAEESLHRALGLTDDEFEAVGKILGRPPNHLELALYAVMWSEHCSYKSSRLHLRRLPTDGPKVLVGPGENAGVIDAGDGIAVAIRIESHNHPSAIEPYQGAATGVGGILRDIFTMGARPLAVMDPLFFGPPDDARQRWLVEGVVSGISGYGNSVGVPTVGGELTFDPCYAQNPLVNVLCMGALPVERLVLGIASGPGNLAVLLGSSTGRDGIGGVSVLASAGFSGEQKGAADDTKRPSVQVGDPFEEKRLIEACLELLDTKLVVGIQDLGGAGLACATSETAGRGGVGMDVDVTAVPRREDGMEPWEVMTSESQERMLAIVTPESWPAVAAICAKWEVRASVIGIVTEPGPDGGGRLRIRDGLDGPVLADVPAASLSDDAPLYDRPRRAPRAKGATGLRLAPPTDCAGDLLALMRSARWVYGQYDHQLFLNTVAGPGGDAALLRLAGPGLPPSSRGVAITTDSNPRACALDPTGGHRAGPRRGRRQPGLRRGDAGRGGELPELREPRARRGDVGALGVHRRHGRGLPRAVVARDRRQRQPLQRERRRRHRPHAGARRARPRRRPARAAAGPGVVRRRHGRVAGRPRRRRRLLPAGRDPLGHRAARPPNRQRPCGGLRRARRAVRLRRRARRRAGRRGRRRRCGRRRCPSAPLVGAVHDVSGGGLAVGLAEMAAAAGTGCVLGRVDPAELFTELPSRFVLATARPDELAARAVALGIPNAVLGQAGGDRFVVDGLVDLPVAALGEAAERNLAGVLGEP